MQQVHVTTKKSGPRRNGSRAWVDYLLTSGGWVSTPVSTSGKPVRASRIAVTAPNAPALRAAIQFTSPRTRAPVPMYASIASAKVRRARIPAALNHFFQSIMKLLSFLIVFVIVCREGKELSPDICHNTILAQLLVLYPTIFKGFPRVQWRVSFRPIVVIIFDHLRP